MRDELSAEAYETAKRVCREYLGRPPFPPLIEAVAYALDAHAARKVAEARAEALEEAAQVVEDEFPPDASEECAARIRALKDKP